MDSKKTIQNPFRNSSNDDAGEPPRKKAKKGIKVLEGLKNPLMALNELKPNLVYDIVGFGPPHNMLYTATITVDGKTYSAQDTTKKKAKTRVAQMYLQCTVQLKDPSVRSTHVIASQNEDFSQDPSEFVKNSSEFFSSESTVIHKVKEVPLSSSNPVEAAKNNPLHILKQLRKDAEFQIIKEEGPSHQRVYTAQVVINGRIFQGTGSSKKLAKHDAAQLALKQVFNYEAPLLPCHGEAKQESSPDDFGDYVSRLIESTFEDLVKDELLARYKVMAGIVMTRGPSEHPEVVCVTTGSKVINGGCLSLEGSVLNDCHAEILARRALIHFLYDQIEAYASRPSESIFEQDKNGGQRLKLKDNILFHLYISSAPCGDARIFTLNDAQDPLKDLHPNRLSRGTLRTKIESGEGTIPITDNVIQTWDGILHSERLLTMSCSDKMARWNVTGAQGSLLSHIINPVYFSTIIVGSCFHRVHLRRALVGRIEHLQGLPSPFVLSRPILVKTSQEPHRQPSKAPKHSMIWAKGWKDCEFIDVSKGKQNDGSLSRLSKRSLFARFVEVMHLRPEWRTVVEGHASDGHVTYIDMKNAARAFNEAKNMVFVMFANAKLGKWVKKPLEQDGFDLSLTQLPKSLHTRSVNPTLTL